MNTHKFTVTVKTHCDRVSAELALLSAFAKRQPDGCGFYVDSAPKPKSKIRIRGAKQIEASTTKSE